MKKITFERIKSDLSKNKQTKQQRSFLYKTKDELPKRIRLEACSLCQLNCAACWMRMDEERIKREEGLGYLRFDDFKNLVDDNPQIEEIELSNNGEIFLNPELDKIMKYAYEKNISLFARNGVNLNQLSDEMAENIVKYQLKVLSVSIDGATPEIYKIYRRGGDLNRVIANIKKINKFKKKYNSKYPEMTYKFIIFNHNIEDIPLAKELANELGMYIFFYQNCQSWYAPLSEEQKARVEDLIGAKIESTSNKQWLKAYQNGTCSRFFCQQLFEYPQIDWNGKLLGCCYSTISGFNVNVFKQGLFKALNNARVLYAKRMLSDFSVPPKEDVICSSCSIYSLLKEENYEMYSDRNLN